MQTRTQAVRCGAIRTRFTLHSNSDGNSNGNSINLEPPIKLNRNEHIKSKSALVGNSSRRLHAILIVVFLLFCLLNFRLFFFDNYGLFSSIGNELNVLMCSLTYRPISVCVCVIFHWWFSFLFEVIAVVSFYFDLINFCVGFSFHLFFSLCARSLSIIQTRTVIEKYFTFRNLFEIISRATIEIENIALWRTEIEAQWLMDVSMCLSLVCDVRSSFPYCQFSVKSNDRCIEIGWFSNPL